MVLVQVSEECMSTKKRGCAGVSGSFDRFAVNCVAILVVRSEPKRVEIRKSVCYFLATAFLADLVNLPEISPFSVDLMMPTATV